MKHAAIYTFLLLCCKSATAQEADSIVSTTMERPAFYYGHTSAKAAASFEVKKEPVAYRRAFKVTTAQSEDEVYRLALGFARTLSKNVRGDKEKGTIKIPVKWQYAGGNNECIENMDLQAQLVIEVKDIKTRISLTHIKYQHQSKEDGSTTDVAKTDFFSRHAPCAPSSGPVELLYNCSECGKSLKSVEKSWQSYFDNLADQYHEALKRY